MKICFVCIMYLDQTFTAELAVHGPCLMAKTLGNKHKLYFLYSGTISRALLYEHGILPVEYGRESYKFHSPLREVYRYLDLCMKVNRLARIEKVEVFTNVWWHHILFPLWLGTLFTRARIFARVVTMVIGAYPKYTLAGKTKRMLGLMVERLSLRLAKRAIAISEYLREMLLQRKVPLSKIEVISTGVDTELFRPMAIEEKEGTRLIFVGRLDKNKDPNILLEAMKILRIKNSQIYLSIVGDGPEYERLVKKMACFDIESRVSFVGAVANKELPFLYNSHNIAVFPTRYSEGLGKTCLEAQACGLPVVVSEIGGLKELAANGRGLLFRPGDVVALVREIEKLASSEEIRKKMGKKGREYVLKEHSFEAVSATYDSVFGRHF